MSRTREYINIVQDELARVGIKIHTIQPTGHGHMRLRFLINGKEQTLITGTSKSDWRATHNQRSRIKRLIREHGLI